MLTATDFATESLGNSVAEFKYLRLSCRGPSRSRCQAGMFDGEGVGGGRRERRGRRRKKTIQNGWYFHFRCVGSQLSLPKILSTLEKLAGVKVL